MILILKGFALQPLSQISSHKKDLLHSFSTQSEGKLSIQNLEKPTLQSEGHLNTFEPYRAKRAKEKELTLLQKCIKLLTKKGKQSQAHKIVKKTFSQLEKIIQEKKLKGTSGQVFEEAVLNIKPLFELRTLRLSGRPHQFPAFISSDRQEKIALRWFIETAQKKKRKSNLAQGFDFFLASEIMDGFQNQGELRKKREGIHRLAEKNRGLAHRRWW